MSELSAVKLVSVVMTTYNEPASMISESVSSVLNQTYQNLELLIYDDSTNKDTIDAIDGFTKDARVKVVRGKQRIGFVPSLNMGLSSAKGEYIARMDGDDISLPERFEIEVGYLEAHKDVDIIGGQLNIINQDGEIVSARHYPLQGVKLFVYSTVRCPLAHPTVMMRRGIIDAGFRYDEGLRTCEDLDLWLRLLNSYVKMENVSDTLLNYRVTDNFLSKRSNRQQLVNIATVRRKNFSKKHLLRSIMSSIAAWLVLNAPVTQLQRFYNRENKQ